MRVLTPRLLAVLEPEPQGHHGAGGGAAGAGAGGPPRSARRGVGASPPAGHPPIAGPSGGLVASLSASSLGVLAGGGGSARTMGQGRYAAGLRERPPSGACVGAGGLASNRGSDTVRSAGSLATPLLQPGHGHAGYSDVAAAAAAAAAAMAQAHGGSSSSGAAPAGPHYQGGSDGEESSAFDLLHTEKGFAAFEQWYRRGLSAGPGQHLPTMPRADLGVWWPQAFVPPNAVHEHAFMDLVRVFAECSEGEAMDLFDLLDHELLGALALPQVYMAILLIAALGCKQLTKFLHLHSTAFFGMLSSGCRLSAAPDHVTWARILTLLRLLGAPGYLISRLCVEFEMKPTKQLAYNDFLEVAWAAAAQLDRRGGAGAAEVALINEGDRAAVMRSKMCAIL